MTTSSTTMRTPGSGPLLREKTTSLTVMGPFRQEEHYRQRGCQISSSPFIDCTSEPTNQRSLQSTKSIALVSVDTGPVGLSLLFYNGRCREVVPLFPWLERQPELWFFERYARKKGWKYNIAVLNL